ncbi:unnamed protein product [Linum tenue]|uniref:Sieve element occlusion C-terminal domain-containing protein n=1 Tax=Linum tenue TaxID=586396 RepID=A0AAV0R1R3_9ROSI|nr:unnamed protein product [Linum tenue]
MLFSKIQQGKLDDHDPMMLEIKKLLSYDKEGGWAVLSKGSNIISNGHGNTVLSHFIRAASSYFSSTYATTTKRKKHPRVSERVEWQLSELKSNP